MLASSPTRRTAPAPLEDTSRHDNTRRDHSPSPIVSRTSALGTSGIGAATSKAFSSSTTVEEQHQHRRNPNSFNTGVTSYQYVGTGGASASSTTTTRVMSQTFARSSDNDIMMLIRGIDEKLSGALHR
jgi:hypothetical protein